MSVCSERKRAVGEVVVLLEALGEALGDALLPHQAADRTRVESGEERQVRVEVVELSEPFYDLDELRH